MGSLRIELILNLVFVCCLNDVNGAKVHLQLFLVIFAKVGDLNVASSTILLQLWGIFLLASQLQLLLNWSKTRHLLTQLYKTKIREISGSTQTPFCNFFKFTMINHLQSSSGERLCICHTFTLACVNSSGNVCSSCTHHMAECKFGSNNATFQRP